MTAARALLRLGWSAVWRPLVVGAVVGATMWALGMRGSSAALVAMAAATFVAVVQRVDSAAEPRPEPRHHVSADGVRGEVLDLAWTMVGRDGRAGERALRRLREAGARRVARHGLDLADPDQADVLRDLLGDRALTTLTRRSHPLPGVGDLVHTLDVLERLGPTRTRPAPPQGAPDPRSPR